MTTQFKTCHNLLVAISDEMILWYLIDSCIKFYGDHSYCSAGHWRAVVGPISLPVYLGWTANIVNETVNSERGNCTGAHLSHGRLQPDSPKKINVKAKQSACRTSDHLVPSLPQTSKGMYVCTHVTIVIVSGLVWCVASYLACGIAGIPKGQVRQSTTWLPIRFRKLSAHPT